MKFLVFVFVVLVFLSITHSTLADSITNEELAWVRSGGVVWMTSESATAAQNILQSAPGLLVNTDTTFSMAVSMIPIGSGPDTSVAGGHTLSLTWEAGTGGTEPDTIWVYSKPQINGVSTGTDSIPYIGLPGRISVFYFRVAQGDTIRINKQSTGPTRLAMIEGVLR